MKRQSKWLQFSKFLKEGNDEKITQLSFISNRSISQTKQLFILCNNDFSKLYNLEAFLKKFHIFATPSTAKEVEAILKTIDYTKIDENYTSAYSKTKNELFKVLSIVTTDSGFEIKISEDLKQLGIKKFGTKDKFIEWLKKKNANGKIPKEYLDQTGGEETIKALL